jgi:sterol desaturase/sphingolipid hydroxylase (fatty acid hydroxylase superfamily)
MNYEIHERLCNIAQFLFILEFIAYWYHRLSHEITTIYKNSHKDHHINIQVYPIDFLEFDYIDNIAQTLYINVPLYFVPMNINDYAIIYYIYATSAFLIHSPLITNHHIIHHQRFKCNYSLLFPFFDILFGTYAEHP